MGIHYYNGYNRRDYRPRTYFVEYTLCDGTPRVADYAERGEAESFIEQLRNPAQGGGCTFVRFYRVFRGKEKEITI